MIHYRSFLNRDPPALADLWRMQPPLSGRMQPLSAAMLEEAVLALPYFEREGLIVAVEGARPLGFVHAGFGSLADGSGVDSRCGVIAMLLVAAHERRGEIAVELHAAAEEFLRKRGATELRVGCAPPADPFYNGLYGGAHGVGVLAEDQLWTTLLLGNDLERKQEWTLWQRSLHDFRPTLDRQQMQFRRSLEVTIAHDPPTETWWEACHWSHAVRTRYDLVPRGGGPPAGAVWAWDMQPRSGGGGVRRVGLLRCQDTDEMRRDGRTKFLLTELLHHLQQEHATSLEIAIAGEDTELNAIVGQLGFKSAGMGTVFGKAL